MSNEVNFVDIMETRRTRGDTFSYMSRYWSPRKTYVLTKCYSPQDLKDTVASSVYIDAVLDAESSRTGIRKEKLRQEVLEYLEEMGLDKRVYAIRWMGIMFLKISLMMKIQVFVNETAVLDLKKDMGKNPVLFLPTHRSYADFCLLTYLCYHYNIDFPAVAAGMDFYSMAVFGRLLRETCAFYIRRTLTGSSLYAATLRQYVRTVVSRHCAPIEFFVEGTRSRSNKSLPPKYGMLAMALMPLFAGEVSDVTVVPINISYDRLMEQNLFAYEHIGVPKPKESTGGFIKALSSLNDHFGNIYINFGSPISVRDYIRGKPMNSRETLNPVDLQQLTPEQFLLVQDIANHVVMSQQRNTVITISNLLALVLMQYMIKNTTLVCDDLINEVEWMIKMLRDLGVSVFENDINASVERMMLVHHKMVRVEKNKTVKLVCGPPMTMTDDVRKKMKGHILKPETMMNAIPIVQLQLYVNPVLHYLIPPAIVTCLGSIRCNKTQLAENFHRIRKLLKYEFFYCDKNDDLTYENALSYCIQHDVIAIARDTYGPGGDEKLQCLLKWSIWPALTIVTKCMEIMMECGQCDHKSLLRRVQERVELANCHPYCLSLEATANCLQGLVLVGALARDKSIDNAVYKVLPITMEDYHSMVLSVLPYFDVDFGTNNPVISSHVPSRL